MISLPLSSLFACFPLKSPFFILIPLNSCGTSFFLLAAPSYYGFAGSEICSKLFSPLRAGSCSVFSLYVILSSSWMELESLFNSNLLFSRFLRFPFRRVLFPGFLRQRSCLTPHTSFQDLYLLVLFLPFPEEFSIETTRPASRNPHAVGPTGTPSLRASPLIPPIAGLFFPPLPSASPILASLDEPPLHRVFFP